MYEYDGKLVVEPAYYSNGVPVFTPTMSEFADFYQFNKAINKYGMESGIVKIIPPAQWLASTSSCYSDDQLKNIVIKNPIVQHINGQQPGVYSQQNVEKQRTYNIYQWKHVSEQSNFQPPVSKGKRRQSTHEKTENSTYSIDISDFTDDRCQELEKNYWRTLTYAEPMYGADMLGSLFPTDSNCWNVARLPNILDLIDEKLPGVNEAYLYAGLWKATFSWHLEDQDLYSINYLHFGAPKQWYSIPQAHSEEFFNLMKETFDDEYKNCPEFLRHKTFLVSPQFLDKHNIKYNKIVHRQGEFMITYPYGYHAGFNYGYNLAESVNFALDDWFPIGEVSKKCNCVPDAVGINVKQLYCAFKGIPYEYQSTSESTEDDNNSVEPEEINPTIVKPKRKPGTTVQKKSKPQAKLVSDCLLCPNSFSRLPLHNSAFFSLINSDAHQKVHRICASMFPKELTITAGSVVGMQHVSKGQQKLRCMVCKEIDGQSACFQCSNKKCTRSFHGTCGLTDGVLYDFANRKAFCKYHRSKPSWQTSELTKIKSGNCIQFVFNKRNYFGKVIANYWEEHSLITLVYPECIDYIEIGYDQVTAKYDENDIFLSNETLKRKSDSAMDYHVYYPPDNYTHESVKLSHKQIPSTKKARNNTNYNITPAIPTTGNVNYKYEVNNC